MRRLNHAPYEIGAKQSSDPSRGLGGSTFRERGDPAMWRGARRSKKKGQMRQPSRGHLGLEAKSGPKKITLTKLGPHARTLSLPDP